MIAASRTKGISGSGMSSDHGLNAGVTKCLLRPELTANCQPSRDSPKCQS
jgi:hypothetical protein